MTASTTSPTQLLGYLTFAELAEHGIVGGYLLVNQFARPVEFHCSAPVCPNRTQEILYGPTLRPFLYGEQIGQTLVRQSRLKPKVLLTDEALALGLRTLIDVPLALLRQQGDASDPRQHQDDEVPFDFDDCRLSTSQGFAADQSLIISTLRQLVCGWDVYEPLDRIREAIREAQRAAA